MAAGSRRRSISCDSWAASMAAPTARTSSALGLVAEMTSSGVALSCTGAPCYYAGGWQVRPIQGDANWWHGGSLPGTTSIRVRSYHNFSWAAVFGSKVTPDDARRPGAARDDRE